MAYLKDKKVISNLQSKPSTTIDRTNFLTLA